MARQTKRIKDPATRALTVIPTWHPRKQYLSRRVSQSGAMDHQLTEGSSRIRTARCAYGAFVVPADKVIRVPPLIRSWNFAFKHLPRSTDSDLKRSQTFLSFMSTDQNSWFHGRGRDTYQPFSGKNPNTTSAMRMTLQGVENAMCSVQCSSHNAPPHC